MASAAYRRHQERQLKRADNPDYQWAVPVAVAQRLIEAQCKRHHLSYKSLSVASGVALSQVWRIRTGKATTVYPKTIQKLMDLPHLKAPYFVPQRASELRVRALQAKGWRISDLKRLSYSEINIYRADEVLFTNAERIVGLVQQYGNVDGPSVQGRRVAAGKGWLTADQYDRDLFDDPCWDGLGGLLRPSDDFAGDLEDLRFLMRSETDLARIAERLGRPERWVRETLRRKVMM